MPSLFSGIIPPLMGVTGSSPLWDFPFGKEGRLVSVAVLAHHSLTLSRHTQISPAGLASGRAAALLNRLVESVTVIQTLGPIKKAKKSGPPGRVALFLMPASVEGSRFPNIWYLCHEASGAHDAASLAFNY